MLKIHVNFVYSWCGGGRGVVDIVGASGGGEMICFAF